MKQLWPPHNRPAACNGCPRNRIGISEGFVPGCGDLRARLVCIGEQPGDMEVREGLPFIGASGRELDKALGGSRANVFITNIRKCQGLLKAEDDEVRVGSMLHCIDAYLQKELNALYEARTIVAIGLDAMKVIAGVDSAIKYHGSVFTHKETDALCSRSTA